MFSSGINLTRIYQGKQSYLSFLFRSSIPPGWAALFDYRYPVRM